jgi:Domain of unknown function (DUF4351)
LLISATGFHFFTNYSSLAGERQAFLKMVRHVLLRRVGAIDPEVDRQLQSLSVEQLEALHDAALDFTTLSDLLIWLN